MSAVIIISILLVASIVIFKLTEKKKPQISNEFDEYAPESTPPPTHCPAGFGQTRPVRDRVRSYCWIRMCLAKYPVGPETQARNLTMWPTLPSLTRQQRTLFAGFTVKHARHLSRRSTMQSRS